MPQNVKLPAKENVKTKDDLENGSRLIKAVTFFGDSAIPEDNEVYKATWEAAKLLAENGYAIVNGGGPGIMKAATDGAESVNGDTVAVYWQPKLASFFEGRNLANVTDESETQSNYMMRTLGLIEHGDAYVVCKGGTGTVSEFGMVWALAKLYYGCHKPVILYGDFWDALINSLQETMNIDQVELGVLYQARQPEDILNILKEHEKKLEHCAKKADKSGEENAFLIGHSSDVTKQAYNETASEYHSEHAGDLLAQEELDEFMAMLNPPAQILDIGAGPGYDAQYLNTKFSVTAIEMSERMAEIARFENPEMKIITADITEYDLEANKYKGIWARDSLHHIREDKQDATFQKLANALVQGGILYVIVREGEGEFVEKQEKNYQKIEKFYHLFSEQELRDRAEKAGLEMIRVEQTQRSHSWLRAIFKKK